MHCYNAPPKNITMSSYMMQNNARKGFVKAHDKMFSVNMASNYKHGNLHGHKGFTHQLSS